MSIEEKMCEACTIDALAASQESVSKFVQEFSNWELSQDVEFPQLKRVFLFQNFSDAQKFVNNVGELANNQGHHPTILLEYGKVTVRWWSHKIMGLHQMDIDLSMKTELAYLKSN
jgi:4a-hydroxytetrahydrobiopterin dehydratase